jgi:hypothetical protein
LGVENWEELSRAEHQFRVSSHNWHTSPLPFPSDFPAPRLAMPESKFAPDYFVYSSRDFVSRRLRKAFAQPDTVIQYLPVDLTLGGNAARAQDYCWMRILARQPAIDVDRSNCRTEEVVHAITGRTMRFLRDIGQLSLLDDLQPLTEIFSAAESVSYVFCTDALAAPVLAAGCNGIEFADPTNLQIGKHIARYRTATGIAERRIGFLD